MFGRQFREEHFLFEPGVTELNHGSYGSAPKEVLEAQYEHLKRELAFPNRYMRQELYQYNLKAREAIAPIVDADVEDLVFTTNATTAVNTVLRSLPWESGDKILYLSTIYGSCRNTLDFLAHQQGVLPISVPIELPCTSQDVQDAVAKAFDEHPDAKMLFFDTISSMPAVRFPWEKLVEMCRKRNILSFVDGAHAIGIIPISLRKSRPDFFTSNTHKWFYGNHSVAVFYVDRKHQRKIVSLPVSAHYVTPSTEAAAENDSAFGQTFSYVGTADYSAVHSLVDLVKFCNDTCGGVDAIMRYQNELCRKASELVCRELGATDVGGKGPEYDMAMFTIVCPLDVPADKHVDFIQFAMDKMINEYKVFVSLQSYNGKIYWRFSATIYLELEDFHEGVRVVKQVIEDWYAKHD